jgi:hypothetical protein
MLWRASVLKHASASSVPKRKKFVARFQISKRHGVVVLRPQTFKERLTKRHRDVDALASL